MRRVVIGSLRRVLPSAGFAATSPAARGRTLALCALAALAVPAPAFAGQTVDLRPVTVGHAGVITLGDLFDGASGPSALVVVGRAAVGAEAVLDAGEVQLAARSAGLDWANAQGRRRIIVAVVGARDTMQPGRRHARQAQVLVYAHNVAAGDILDASDLEWSDEAIAGPDAPDRPDGLIGKAARMPLRAGAAVAAHDLMAPKVIRRDQMIAVDYSGDGVTLSLTAKAMNDAAVGDTVQVQNLASKKVIEAVATAPGHAAVGPGADAAREQAMSPGFRTAALQ